MNRTAFAITDQQVRDLVQVYAVSVLTSRLRMPSLTLPTAILPSLR